MYLIEFSSQCGFNIRNKYIRLYYAFLNRIFSRDECKGQRHYFRTLETFSIVFRIAGGRLDFGGGEGAERLRKGRNQPYYTVDLVIPQSAWENKSDEELRPYVANGVRECFSLLREKALKNQEIIDLGKLDADFEKGVAQFLTQPFPHFPNYR